MISDKNDCSIIGGKTARPCDGCAKKRASWYCATDDAFLCQACDSSVHSANVLAGRHQRVQLKTASHKSFDAVILETSIPSWNRGPTKKARTPRLAKHHSAHKKSKLDEPMQNSFPLVPEVSYDDISLDENEEQLLYRVPIYDPFIAELCSPPPNSNDAASASPTDEVRTVYATDGNRNKTMIFGFCDDGGDDHLNEFLPSEMDLADLSADVESLLGRGLENESFVIEELGLIQWKDDSSSRVKPEEHEEAVKACQTDMELDLSREPFQLNFDYDSHATEEEEKAVARLAEDGAMKKEKMLRLDYQAVITAWSDSQRSPWITGTRPDLEDWSDFMGTSRTETQYYTTYGETSGMGTRMANGDGGREARVSRYREKRRTRLFSKKIRYEVRKLNAEKRPRMKGRFVKRASFVVPGFSVLG